MGGPLARPWLPRAATLLLFLAGCGTDSGSPTPPTNPSPPAERGPVPPAGAITRGPYLQHADDGVAVVWYTDVPTEGRVRWAADGGATKESVSSGLATRHEAVIGPLAAGARYSYQVHSTLGVLAAAGGEVDFSFRAPDKDVLRLVVFGDSGLGGPAQYAVAEAIGREATAPDLVMIVGDVVYPPAEDAWYDPRFFAPYRALLPAVPFYAALGNHDYEVRAGQPFLDVFTLPRNGPAGLVPESSYWLERAGVQMIVHDTNQSVATLRSLSMPWHAEVALRPATFRLVFQHHPMYSSGPGSDLHLARAMRTLVAPVYAATGVDVVFNGHDHFYERTAPIRGIVYVTTGAGGAELYERQQSNDFTVSLVNDRHSYTYVEVRGRTLLLRQTDTEGRAVDALEITKPVASPDGLRAFAGAGEPPRGWAEPAFDDSGWPKATRPRFASALRARRAFDLDPGVRASEAVLRVLGAREFVARLNGVEVGRGGDGGEAGSAFPVPLALLRPGRNVVALEGQVEGTEEAPPSLELSLLSSPPR